MGEVNSYLVLAAILALALFGLVGYARFTGKKTGKSKTRPGLSPSEKLVGVVDIVEGDYFLTDTGCLLALFAIQPILATVDLSPQALEENFAAIVQALEPKSSIQIVSFPLPARVGALADRYAQHASHWRQEAERAQVRGDEQAAERASNRYFAVVQIGGEILQVGGSAPRRASFVVLSRSVGMTGKVSPSGIARARQALQVDAERLAALFGANGLPITRLEARQALEVLWSAYHPDRSGLDLYEQEQERWIEITQTGQGQPADSETLAPEPIERVLASPREEIRRFLAPTQLEESEASVRFGEQELLLYFLTDFRSAVPPLRRLFGREGRFAQRIFSSCFITSPSSDEMARAARKASTAKQALQTIAQRAGSLPSYKQAEEVLSIEQARAGAETEKNVPKLLGWYLGLLTTRETAQADRIEFESTLRSAGMEFVLARWMALDVWRTLLPLGQRYHRYEERNLFSENLAPLNPAVGTAPYDPQGEFCGFVAYGENAGQPVAIRRERGGEFLPSDAVVGAQGSGKSFTLKLWVTDWIARGQRAFVIDPKLEFGALTQALGGSALSLQGARGFNLLQFETLPATPGSDLAAAVSNLVFADNLSALEALYTLAKGGRGRASGVERNLLTNVLKRAMSLKGLDPKNAATWSPDRVFLADVYAVLTREMLDQDPETVRLMAGVLEQYGDKSGQYFELYNTSNTFSLESDLITATFGLAQLGRDDTAKSLSAHFALRLAVNHAVRSFLLSPHPIPFHIVIDEASQLLVTPALVGSVVAMLSLLSAYGISVHLAFQTMDALRRADGLGTAENASSMNTLSGTIPAYWLFHQEPSSAEAAVKMLDLPPSTAARIVRQPVGGCILAFPKADLRIPLAVRVPEAFQPLFRTDPAAMRALIEQALIHPEARQEVKET